MLGIPPWWHFMGHILHPKPLWDTAVPSTCKKNIFTTLLEQIALLHSD